jgi:lysophospholipase L1-like esterase
MQENDRLFWFAVGGCLVGAGVGAAIVLLSSHREPEPAPAEGAVGPSPAPIARCPPSGTRVLLCGDSYAQGLSAAMEGFAQGCTTPFVARFVVGSHVTEWASDAWIGPALAASTPNVVLVSLGANDFKRNDPENVQTGVTALVSKIRAAGARVLWIAPLSEPFSDSVGTLGMWKQAVGEDWYDSSLLHLPRSGDGIHSTPAGYAAWAQMVWQWMGGRLGAGSVAGLDGPSATRVPHEWLKRRVSFAEVERKFREDEAKIKKAPVLWKNPNPPPPTHFKRQWQQFKGSALPGDELWYYESGWGFLSGEAGYALVRDGRVVDGLVTLVS